MRILFSNLGYARGIGGKAAHHMMYAHRHIYCRPSVQKKALAQLATLVAAADPDICCFVEIDSGSFDAGGYNQMAVFKGSAYAHHNIENKYAEKSWLRRFPFTRGKSNAFAAKRPIAHEKLYFSAGVKRLIYKLTPAPGLTVFFAHFSLKREVRQVQLREARVLIDAVMGEALFLGDFNIMDGIKELQPLTGDGRYALINDPAVPTFRFHKWRMMLDLCIATPGIAMQARLRVVEQHYSDHAALVVDIGDA